MKQEKSLAREKLEDYKKANQRMFWIIIAILIMWFITLIYLAHTLNDIGTSEETSTIDIDDVNEIDNSHIKIGDDKWEKLE